MQTFRGARAESPCKSHSPAGPKVSQFSSPISKKERVEQRRGGKWPLMPDQVLRDKCQLLCTVLRMCFFFKAAKKSEDPSTDTQISSIVESTFLAHRRSDKNSNQRNGSVQTAAEYVVISDHHKSRILVMDLLAIRQLLLLFVLLRDIRRGSSKYHQQRN